MSSSSSQKYILDFEKPLHALTQQIDELEASTSDNEACQEALHALQAQLEGLKESIYFNLSAPQKLQIARHPERPHTLDYVQDLGFNWLELHGDRHGADDQAIVGGLLELTEGLTVMLVGTEKGRGIKEKQKHNFGMPQPWGYRKALRLFKHAETFGLPIVTLVDTPGAYPGLEAEEKGQAEAIAKNIQEMFCLRTPIISVITGEGGSGGALALAVADKVCMLEHSVYSVISPEGCAAILWRTRDQYQQAAEALQITAQKLKELGLIDEIIPEPLGGAHDNHKQTKQNLREFLIAQIKDLQTRPMEELLQSRRQKFRDYGFWHE